MRPKTWRERRKLMDSRQYLGIELGSTRIKTVSIDERFQPIQSDSYVWRSEYSDGVWTYSLDEVWKGLREALAPFRGQRVQAAGISGMMHGYLAFDKEWNLLVPFRTWQNTMTGEAAEQLTVLFGFNIPQRWSVAHLFQAVLNGEEHLNRLAHITTLAGYVHYMLTGVNAVGIGEASGMFPIDGGTGDYNRDFLDRFDALASSKGFTTKISTLLPQVLTAGEAAGKLTAQGAELLDGILPEGTPFAPCEGDAGTGMAATNSVAPRTGNVSAGTSVFAMVVLEQPLKRMYPEIDLVMTPSGRPVAMVHCNNCTGDMNAWFGVFKELIGLFGTQPEEDELYSRLYKLSLDGDADCGGVLVYNYIAGEGIMHLDEGRPAVLRHTDSRFTLANFIRAQLYSTMATLKLGMDILKKEDVRIDCLTGHGGLFKTPVVGQKYMAAACGVPITCMDTAGEGGPYGMALLAAYLGNSEESLEKFLGEKVFANPSASRLLPDAADAAGFAAYMDSYTGGIEIERAAVKFMPS